MKNVLTPRSANRLLTAMLICFFTHVFQVNAQSVCTGPGISVHVVTGQTPSNQVCDCFEPIIKVKNLQSNSRNFDIRIVFPQSYLSPYDDEADDFAETLEVGNDYVYRSQNVAFAANEEREFKFKLRAVLFAGFPLNYTGIANESGNPSLCSEGEEVITDVIRTVDAGQNPPSPLSDFYGFTGSPLQDPVTACGPAVQEFILSGTLDVDEDYCIWD